MNQLTTNNSMASFLSKESIKNRINEIVGAESALFTSSLLAIARSPALSKCTPESILGSAIISATLKLHINQNLGYAYIVPYGNEAQFQVGYKGFIQLALRSGQFKRLNVAALTKSQFKGFDPIAEKIEYDYNDLSDPELYCYIGYFQLTNGFEKYFVMTKEELFAHAKKYSKMFSGQYAEKSLWTTDFDNMAKKTVLKLLLSKYAPLSIEMQQAISSDQATFDVDGNAKYIDNEKQKLTGEAKQDLNLEDITNINEE